MRPDGILHVVFDFDDTSPEAAATELLAARSELVGSGPVPVVLEIIRIPYVDRAVREFLMAGIPAPRCRAVVATNPTHLTMFRTYQLVDVSDVPTATFATVDAAVDWIHKQTNSR